MSSLTPAVERKLASAWPLASDQAAVRALLLTYGIANGEQEVERVQLAIIKSSGGALDKVAAMTSAAKTDYRDVLMGAEYPEEARTSWAYRLNLTDAERKELAAIRARDRKQYEDWRNQP